MKTISLFRLLSILTSLFLIIAGIGTLFVLWHVTSRGLSANEKERFYGWLSVHGPPLLLACCKAIDWLQDAVLLLTTAMICAGVINLGFALWGTSRKPISN